MTTLNCTVDTIERSTLAQQWSRTLVGDMC